MSDQTELRKLDSGKDFGTGGGGVQGKGEGVAVLRGLQADLNRFAAACGYDHVKVDGVVGPRAAEAVKKVYAAVIAKNPGLAATPFPPPETAEVVAEFAMYVRFWLAGVAADALGVGKLRRYVRGAGKDWNTKDTIAYGAGEVHKDFVALQQDLNRFAGAAGFGALGTDGFLGPKTADAVKKVYAAVIAKNPGLAATPFPPPDTKEEAAEYCAFIRDWLNGPAGQALGVAVA
ncbi:MAG: hypothetical protein H6709_13345 [Kofleriaceae bacterium]|nr:hypothetical protein [Kofleriaceae bacterium]MCB9573063.1 hypothetical protein [Kofleriaceae bacterium]